jgi:hypothetical protein
MGMPAKVLQLPPNVREELDKRLRQSAYGGFEALERWLTEVAHPIGKSSLHRYANGLKAVDAAKHEDVAVLRLAVRNANRRHTEAKGLPARAVELLARLGALEVEKAEILEQLRPMMAGVRSGIGAGPIPA